MLNDREYWRFCRLHPGLWIERRPDGIPEIYPAAGGEASARNVDVVMALRAWAKRNCQGIASGPTAQFYLADGSALSPDAAWTSWGSLRRTTRHERRTIPHLCPEFVVEILAFNDRLSRLKRKMEQWIANGAQLGWLTDADRQTVYIYQPNRPVETRKGILRLGGTGPVKGFMLQLRTIWEGLK